MAKIAIPSLMRAKKMELQLMSQMWLYILLNEVLPSTQYCFVLTAENQTYTVKLQGQFTGELKQNNNHDYMYSMIQGRKHPQHKHICKSQHHSSSGLTVYKSKFRSYMVQEIPASIVLCKEGRCVMLMQLFSRSTSY